MRIWSKMKRFIVLLMLFALQSYAVSVHLINDSPYDLVAEIQTATGRILGNVSLSPGKDIVGIKIFRQ